LLLEHFIIQQTPFFQKDHDPCTIENTADNEYEEDGYVVDKQDNGEDDKSKYGKNNGNRLIGQEIFNAAMVFDTLQQIAREFGIEKFHRQFHQLDEKIGNERNVDAGADVQQNFAPDEIDSRTTEQQHHLGYEYQPDKMNIFPADAGVHDGLREKREDELKDAADEQSQYKLPEKTLVFQQITTEKFYPVFRPQLIAFLFIEQLGRFQKQSHPFFFATGLGADPMIAKLFLRIGNQSFSGIGNIYFISFPIFLDIVNHYEVILIPMHDARQQCFFCQFIKRELSADRMKADFLRRFANSQHRHAFPPNKTVVTQMFQCVLFSIMLCNHAETCRTAVHRVGLLDEREGHY